MLPDYNIGAFEVDVKTELTSQDYKSSILPIELIHHIEDLRRFELLPNCFEDSYTIHYTTGPKFVPLIGIKPTSLP